MNATQRRICFSIVVLVQSGCATQSARPPEIPRSQLGSLGVANVQFLPKLNLEQAKGIESSLALRQCSGIGVPAIVTLACIPFAAQAAADALRAGTSTMTPAQAETHFRERLSTLQPQSALREHLTRYATEHGVAGMSAIAEGPAAREEQHKYRATPDGPSTVIEVAIVEVAAHTTGVGNIPYFFALTASGRLVRTSDNAVLDSFTHTQMTLPRSADRWVADDGKALAQELDRAYRRLAEAFVDEWFLIYRAPAGVAAAKPAAAPNRTSGGARQETGPSPIPIGYHGGMRPEAAAAAEPPAGALQEVPVSALPAGYAGGMRWGETPPSAAPGSNSGGMQPGSPTAPVQESLIVPVHVLQPVAPVVRRGFRTPGTPAVAGNLVAPTVESLQPRLAWEALPRSVLASGDSPTTKPVYELRIFRAYPVPFVGMRWMAPLPVPEVEARELTSTDFRPARELAACQYYFWTVRARFESDGYRKFTEWSGAYDAGFASVEPWLKRRSYRPPGTGGPVTHEWLYFPFQTPDASGKSC